MRAYQGLKVMLRIRKIFCGSGCFDQYLNFTDPGLDPTHLRAMFKRTICYNITIRSSPKGILDASVVTTVKKYTYVRLTYIPKFVNMIFWITGRIWLDSWKVLTDPDLGSLKVTDPSRWIQIRKHFKSKSVFFAAFPVLPGWTKSDPARKKHS